MRPEPARTPLIDATLTMRPLPCATIARAAAWPHRKTPVRFTASTRFQCSSGSSRNACVPPIPALLTRTSSRPSFSSVRATSAVTSFASLTSVRWVSARLPRAASVSRATSAAARSTSARTTAAPSDASRSAIANPSPAAAPVTIATLPAKSGNPVALLDLDGPAVDRGQHFSRVARDDHVDHGRPVALGHALAQRLAELLRILNPDAAAAHRFGDGRVVHFDEIARLIALAEHRMLQRLDVAGGGIVDDHRGEIVRARAPRGLELADRHVEAAVAGQCHDRPVGRRERRADAARQAVADRSEPA